MLKKPQHSFGRPGKTITYQETEMMLDSESFYRMIYHLIGFLYEAIRSGPCLICKENDVECPN